MDINQQLLILALSLAAVDWAALRFGWKRIDYGAKPGVIMVLILAVAGTTIPGEYQSVRLWVIAALGLSLAGDIFLMLPEERFIAGLVAFIFAYLGYVLAFNPTPPEPGIGLGIILIACGLLVLYLLRRVIFGLGSTGKENLKLPATVFGIVIFLMVTSALQTNLRTDWPRGSAAAIGIGGALIFLSDALLSWDRFVRPIGAGRLKVRIPYHTGQILIALGVTLLPVLAIPASGY